MDYCKKCDNANTSKCNDCLSVKSKGKIVMTPSQYQEKKETYYYVRLRDDIPVDPVFYRTKAAHLFCGKLVNQAGGSHMYFELKNTNDLVIIPHEWIEWMAPTKKGD